MGVSYATRSDVFALGVPRGALTRAARIIASADTSTSRLQLTAHGLQANDAIQFTVDSAGALPAPLAPSTVYYVVTVVLADGTISEDLFQVAATPNGAAITLSTTGTPNFKLAVQVGPALDKHLEYWSRWVDQKVVGQVVPFASPYPMYATRIVAFRAALAIANELGIRLPQLEAREDKEIADFLSFAKGMPLRDANAGPSANTALARTGASGRVTLKRSLP